MHGVLELASCLNGVRGGRVCLNVLGTCVMKMMLRSCTGSWNLHHVSMGWGVGGCVNVLGTCVMKMMLRSCTGSWTLRHVSMGWGVGGCVLTSLALASWRWCYAHARGLGTCVMSQWGEGWAGVLTSLALASWRWCYAHARGLVTCVMSQWGEGWAGVFASLAPASWMYDADATLMHGVLELAPCLNGVRGVRVC